MRVLVKKCAGPSMIAGRAICSHKDTRNALGSRVISSRVLRPATTFSSSSLLWTTAYRLLAILNGLISASRIMCFAVRARGFFCATLDLQKFSVRSRQIWDCFDGPCAFCRMCRPLLAAGVMLPSSMAQLLTGILMHPVGIAGVEKERECVSALPRDVGKLLISPRDALISPTVAVSCSAFGRVRSLHMLTLYILEPW
jgi:hypothetical protein